MKMNTLSFWKRIQNWLPVFLWIALIFWMSTGMFAAQNTYVVLEPLLRFFFPSISQKEIVHAHFLLRKLAHVTEYFISGLLLFRAFRNGSLERKEWRWAGLSLIVVAIIASSDEFHQSLVAARTSSIIDVGIDILGGTLAQGVCVFLIQRKRWSSNKELE